MILRPLCDSANRICTCTEASGAGDGCPTLCGPGDIARTSEVKLSDVRNFEVRLDPSFRHLKHRQSRLVSSVAIDQIRCDWHSRSYSSAERRLATAVVVLSVTSKTNNDWIIFDIRIFQTYSTLGLAFGC